MVSPAVANQRGYWSATKKKELAELGFGKSQQLVPALVVPVFNVHGELAVYQIRPDNPRVKDGKIIKYEMPFGARMVLDVPPSVRSSLGDPKVDLFITEGVRKADAGASQGLCVIDVLGVWNFRGTNERGGRAALGDWESIALNGRRVFIVFDSDVMQKTAVAGALRRLAAFLESRGAKVEFTYLKSAADGGKVGLDDFFASGNTVADLASLATPRIAQPTPDESFDASMPYRAEGSGLVYLKDTRDGPVEVRLTNFTATIVADIRKNNGVEESRWFEIEARVGPIVRRFTIPQEQFSSMNWAMERLGSRALIYPGVSIRDQTRAAIQMLSPEASERLVCTHTGWREFDGRQVYVHGGGAIGTDGTVSVEYDGSLGRYVLSPPPTRERLIEVVKETLRLFSGLAPDSVMLVLIAIVHRAILGDVDFAVHLFGGTGAKKTELASLAQQFFGKDMHAKNLPASWSSTPNSIEEIAFLAKDAVVVVDDFCPNGGQSDVGALHQKAERIFRSVGNHSGRGRLDANLRLRTPHPPRALVLSTGEELPRGHSVRARVLMIEVPMDTVQCERLTECQRLASQGVFVEYTAAFIKWLAPIRTQRLEGLRERARQLGDQLSLGKTHSRTPENFGQVVVGFELMCDFLREVGVSESLIEELRRRLLPAVRMRGFSAIRFLWSTTVAFGDRRCG